MSETTTTAVDLTCDRCGRLGSADARHLWSDSVDAWDDLYDLGWRQNDDGDLCDTCSE